MKTKHKYYIIFESYQDYNQFEGVWNLDMQTFSTLEGAITYKDGLGKSGHIRDIIGPLVLYV